MQCSKASMRCLSAVVGPYLTPLNVPAAPFHTQRPSFELRRAWTGARPSLPAAVWAQRLLRCSHTGRTQPYRQESPMPFLSFLNSMGK